MARTSRTSRTRSAEFLYKRGKYLQALSMLKDSAQKLPNSPEIHYDLGMAAFMVGDAQTSRKALEVAGNSPAQFSGKDETRKPLTRSSRNTPAWRKRLPGRSSRRPADLALALSESGLDVAEGACRLPAR